ncbi:MAG: hypothetical protein WDM80_08330 [Limisphaerales bacterium]
MKMLFSLFLLFVLVAGLSGCGTPGFPKQSYDPDKQIKQLEDVFNKTDLIKEYYATNADEAVKKNVRNKLIDSRLALINLNYNQFVARFAVKKESLDFGTEVAQLGLNLATTATGGEEAKTVLAAIASGVTGTKLAIDKNFFFEKTVPVLITTMNAQRKVTLAPLLIGMTNDAITYSLSRALSDIDAYYFAGTFVGALQTIQAESGAKEAKAEQQITEIRSKQFVAQATQNRIDALLDGISKLSNTAATNLEQNLPVKINPEIDNVVNLRDPGRLRFSNGDVARQMLKMQIVLGRRNEEDLAAWEAAVKSAE